MPDYFNTGFFVEESAWHRLGKVIQTAPTLEEAKPLAGHDFRVVERVNADLGGRRGDCPLTEDEFNLAKAQRNVNLARVDGKWYMLSVNPDKKGLRIEQIRPDGSFGPLHDNSLTVANDTLAVIQNDVAYEFAKAMTDIGFKVWAGITLKDGAVCSLTFKLDEPIQIQGDDSITLPFFVLSWAHDGSGSLTGRSTDIRAVCWNTVSAGEAQGKRLGTHFAIRHTENWKDRVEDAKKALLGTRRDHEEYRQAMEEFASIPVTAVQRELFTKAVVLDQSVAAVSRFKADVARGAYSQRVQTNVETAQGNVMALFNGKTIPEAHKLTAYGLHLAGVEYLDHIRRAHNDATRVGRSLLRDEPAKARLPKLIREVAAL